MFDRFRGQERAIIAGVNLPVNEAYIKSIVSLAKRTEMHLKIVHVVEPWASSGATYPGEYLSISIAKIAEKKRIKDAKVKLGKAVERLIDYKNIETCVLAGKPADGLQSFSTTSGVSLVVSGVKPSTHRFVPRGFSTALSLMADSTIPVLCLPNDKFCDFEKDHLKFMVADNLTESSADLLSTVAELAGTLKNCEIIHYHGHPVPKNELKDRTRLASEIIASGQIRYDLPTKIESVVTDMENAISEKMNKNLEVPNSFLDTNGVTYSQVISFGDVLDELSKAVGAKNPDVIAFGRHHLVHKHPLSIGKIPFHAMLNFGSPVLTISNVMRTT